ncbi:hypothetical protein T4D_12360 [Trichinella pseudospiralis]|uniref:Uncharacterized protein n=1 Tax=Trichinella pseudospiralis TaxID=6337 RepID=A0A0V1FEZ9_TRIPS|nr:hypothetical protein T4D_4342 [Trichinella pseudospiralis]KRY84646.1 hypothetical protein T4D_12360 [Trichinella pseudospiralis]
MRIVCDSSDQCWLVRFGSDHWLDHPPLHGVVKSVEQTTVQSVIEQRRFVVLNTFFFCAKNFPFVLVCGAARQASLQARINKRPIEFALSVSGTFI